MKCLQYKIYFGLFFSFFVSLFSACSTFAVETSLTLDSNNVTSSTYSLCDSNSPCPSTAYLKIFCTKIMNGHVNFSAQGSRIYPCVVSEQLFILDNASSISITPQSAFITSLTNNPNDSVTFTLSDTNPYGSSVSGDLSITENGQYDVSSYSTATVEVPETVVEGDYHEDLSDIKTAIFAGSATLLVIYFFYCIYRMIIKATGGK